MRKFLLAPLIIASVVVAAGYAGLLPGILTHGAAVGTGIGAKLLCSAEFVMGSNRDQAHADMVQYSGLLEQLTIEYGEQSVSANLWGISETTARFVPGLGCYIDYPGYRTRDEINTRPVVASDASWPAGDGVDTHRSDLQTLLEQLVADDNSEGFNTRALLAVHRGQIVAEAYAQGADSSTPLLGWSMAKSLTAIMLGNLEMRGLIHPQVRPLFPEWADDPRADIRLVDLLTMTDGLAFEETYSPGDDATRMLFTEPSAAAFALTRSSDHPPGGTFRYSSGSANLLARAHLNALGSPQAAYDDFQAHIYRPLGFQNAVFEMDASGMFVGSSYFYASARDWARIGLLMLNRGEINGQRVLTESWVRRAVTPNSSSNDRAYGYQWWLNRGNEALRFAELPEDAYFAQGNRQQVVMVAPSHDAVVVRLGWTSGRYPTGANFARILDTLGGSPDSPPPVIAAADQPAT